MVKTEGLDSGKESTGIRRIPLSHIKAHLYDEPVIKRGTAQSLENRGKLWKKLTNRKL